MVLLPYLTQNNLLYAVFELRSRVNPTEAPRDIFLERSLPTYAFYEHLNRTLPADAKLLLFQEIRGFYLKRPYQWGDPVCQGLIRYPEYSTPEALRNRLRDFNITHIVRSLDNPLYGESAYYYDAHTLDLMNRLLARYSTKVWEQNGLQLFVLHH